MLAVAYEFARDILKPEEAEEDGIPLVAPQSAGRHGSVPQVVRRPSLESEASFIADWLKQRHEAGRAWNEMAVLYRAKFVVEKVVAALNAAGISPSSGCRKIEVVGASFRTETASRS